MPALHRKADIETPKVLENGALLPLHQAQITSGSDAHIVLPCSPQPKTTSLGTNTTINFDIERDTVKLINDIILRFTVTCSTADVETLPPHYWMDRLVIEADRGSSDELIHIYPENWIVWDYLTQDRVEREMSQIYENYVTVPYKSEGGEKYSTNTRTKFKAGETRDVYLKIPALFFHLNAIDMSHIRADLRLRLEMSSDIVVSGDVSNLSLDNLNLVVRNFAEEDYDHNHRVARQMKTPHKYIFLDCERFQTNDKSLNAGQTTRIELDQFSGKMGFAILVIKGSASPTGKGKIDFVELGPNGTIDITSPSGQSLLGQGTAIKESYLYQLWTKQTGNPHVKGIYLIPFAQSCKKAIAGRVNGFMEFVGLRDFLEITPDSAGQQEVHTVDLGSTAESGNYRYCFENGAISDQDVDYSDTVTDIKAVIDDMPVLKERDITVTVNQNIESGTSHTITFSKDSGRVSEELGKMSVLLMNDLIKVNNTSVSTVGRRGFSTSGSDFEINVYMYKFKQLNVLKNGQLTCTDL